MDDVARETSAWLGLLPPDGLLVGSAPTSVASAGAAVLPASRVRFQQVLFGFEAQMRAFAQALRRQDRWLRYTPMPEMFASARSLAALSDAVPAAAGRQIVHVRFGPARFARVLKGVRNVMVLADDAVHAPVDGGLSQLGQDNRLPVPFADVLIYGQRRCPVRCLDGQVPRMAALPDVMLHADLDVEAIGEEDVGLRSAPRWATMHGLHVRSLAELGEADWFAGADADPAQALDWRRALAQQGAGGRFIMVPWNLAYGGSVMEDIIVKLAHRQRLAAAGAWIVLFPFNATPVSHHDVGGWLARIREQVGAANESLQRIFFARMTSLADARLLRRLFPLAWVEAEDPEVHWTVGRLAHLEIEFCLIGDQPASLPHRPIQQVRLDVPVRVRVADMFGERTYATRSLSVSRLGALLADPGMALTGRGLGSSR